MVALPLWDLIVLSLGLMVILHLLSYARSVVSSIELSREVGFQPAVLVVEPGSTVRWWWAGPEERHNVLEVTSHLEDLPGGFISGPDLTTNDDFLFTFEEEGVFYAISEGISDASLCCVIMVRRDSERVSTPSIEPNGGLMLPGKSGVHTPGTDKRHVYCGV